MFPTITYFPKAYLFSSSEKNLIQINTKEDYVGVNNIYYL